MPGGSGADPRRCGSATSPSRRRPSPAPRPAPRPHTSARPGTGGRASRCRRPRAWPCRRTAAPRCPAPARVCSRTHLRPDRARAFLFLALLLAVGPDEDGDLAEMLVLVEELVGVGDALEAHHSPQHRLDLALGHQLVRPHALVRVREMRADDLLLSHPEVADVEIERVARGRAADHDLAERLHDEYGGRECCPADMLEDDVGRVAEDLLDALREATGLLESSLLGLRVRDVLVVAHHPGEVVAVDVV